MDKKFYRACAEVDLNAIRHNISEVKKNIDKKTKVMAVIKANAYGHGAVRTAEALEELADAYGVAIVEEGKELREAGVDKMILILGYTHPDLFEEVITYGLSQTVYEYEAAKLLGEVASEMGKTARIHIKVDTGMSRIGFIPTRENAEIVKKISMLPGIEIEGIFTHFARADETSIEPARKPFAAYMQFLDWLMELGVNPGIRHAGNSASIIGFPESNLDMVRSGIITYGIYPSHEVQKDVLKLIPAMELKSRVSYLKEIEPGTAVGYGGTFIAEKKTRVATVPIGYADGMKRDLSGKGSVLIRGQRVPIIGRICMDQFMVDVTEIQNVKEGDCVTIFGRDGQEEITVDEIAELAHSFSYEFLCSVSERVPRKYIGFSD
ncbi:MAG: alanine racemase [Lachnospiraceae bacterium]|nr:alanine racemase [Lachnospiraceae bacterium]